MHEIFISYGSGQADTCVQALRRTVLCNLSGQ